MKQFIEHQRTHKTINHFYTSIFRPRGPSWPGRSAPTARFACGSSTTTASSTAPCSPPWESQPPNSSAPPPPWTYAWGTPQTASSGSGWLPSWTSPSRNHCGDTHTCRKPYISHLSPLFVDRRVRAGRTNGIRADAAVMLSEFPEDCEADLALRLLFVLLLVDEGDLWVRVEVLGMVRV